MSIPIIFIIICIMHHFLSSALNVLIPTNINHKSFHIFIEWLRWNLFPQVLFHAVILKIISKTIHSLSQPLPLDFYCSAPFCHEFTDLHKSVFIIFFSFFTAQNFHFNWSTILHAIMPLEQTIQLFYFLGMYRLQHDFFSPSPFFLFFIFFFFHLVGCKPLILFTTTYLM